MKPKLITLRLFIAALMTLAIQPGFAADKKQKTLRALLITGGCCHNYIFQSQALIDGVAKHAKVNWTVINEGGKGTKAMIPLYKNPNWAKDYDVVVHNECFANTSDKEYVQSITKAHEAGVPAVVIHCAMHTYRASSFDDWRKFLGVTSKRHEHKSEYPVKKVMAKHPILKDMPNDWKTPKDELYVVEKLWPNAKALATSVSERDKREHAVIWTHQYGKARVFGTTYGHSDETFKDPVFLNYVSRGLLWAADRLNEK